MNPAHSHPPDARDISHVMVSTYPKSSSHQHCSTPQVYSPDRIQASRNLHQPERLPSNSLSATRPLGSAYHLNLQHIACCYTLQLHSGGVDRAVRAHVRSIHEPPERYRDNSAQHTVIASLPQHMPYIVRGTYYQRVLARLYWLQDARTRSTLLQSGFVPTLCCHSLCACPPRCALQAVRASA